MGLNILGLFDDKIKFDEKALQSGYNYLTNRSWEDYHLGIAPDTNSYYHSLKESNFVKDVLVSILWKGVQGLSYLLDSVQKMFVKTYELQKNVVSVLTLERFLSQEVRTALITMLLFLSIGFLIIKVMLGNKMPKLAETFGMILLVVLVMPIMLTEFMNMTTTFAKNFSKTSTAIGSEGAIEESTSFNIVSPYIIDHNLIMTTQFGSENPEIEVEGTPARARYTFKKGKPNLLTSYGQSYNTLTSNTIATLNPKAKMDNDFLLNYYNNDGYADYVAMHILRFSPSAEKGIVDISQIKSSRVGGMDFTEWNYRYTIDYLPIYIILFCMFIAYLFSMIRAGKLIFELGYNQIYVQIFVWGDIHSGAKTRELIKHILGIFTILMLIPFNLEIFRLSIDLINTTWATDVVFKVIATIIATLAMLEAFTVMQSILGIDANVKSSFGAVMGAFSAGKAVAGKGLSIGSVPAKKVGSAVGKGAKNAGGAVGKVAMFGAVSAGAKLGNRKGSGITVGKSGKAKSSKDGASIANEASTSSGSDIPKQTSGMTNNVDKPEKQGEQKSTQKARNSGKNSSAKKESVANKADKSKEGMQKPSNDTKPTKKDSQIEKPSETSAVANSSGVKASSVANKATETSTNNEDRGIANRASGQSESKIASSTSNVAAETTASNIMPNKTTEKTNSNKPTSINKENTHQNNSKK